MNYKPRLCEHCDRAMAKHPTLKLWRCKLSSCRGYDRPYYEKQDNRKRAA